MEEKSEKLRIQQHEIEQLKFEKYELEEQLQMLKVEKDGVVDEKVYSEEKLREKVRELEEENRYLKN